MQNLAMTKWLILLHCERFFRISWQSIILNFIKDSIVKLLVANIMDCFVIHCVHSSQWHNGIRNANHLVIARKALAFCGNPESWNHRNTYCFVIANKVKQSIILHKEIFAMESQMKFNAWIASSLTAFIPRNDSVIVSILTISQVESRNDTIES